MGDRDHNPEPPVYDALNNAEQETIYQNITLQQQQHQALQQQGRESYETVS